MHITHPSHSITNTQPPPPPHLTHYLIYIYILTNTKTYKIAKIYPIKKKFTKTPTLWDQRHKIKNPIKFFYPYLWLRKSKNQI